MSARGEIGVGVIGLGFMGRTHVRAYQAAQAAGHPCMLVSVCDQNPQRLEGLDVSEGNIEQGAARERLFDPALVRARAEVDELLGDPSVGLVSICTPTETHADLAVRALAAGKHVLIEKPVAVTSQEVERVLAASSRSEKLCMPAFCMRFWPGWDWLKARVEEGTFGAVRSAVFQRLACPPSWSPEFYRDVERTGGALTDLHIHDVDFVRWCFGDPSSVQSTGSLDHLTTLYRFGDSRMHVTAEGGWDHTPGFPFRMRYVVIFEEATADFELGRDPALRLHRAGSTEIVTLDDAAGYDGEIRHLVNAIASGKGELAATMQDAAAVARLLEAERESLTRGDSVSFRG